MFKCIKADSGHRKKRFHFALAVLISFFASGAIFAQPPLSGGDCVIVCPPNPNIQCACIPTGPVTPPSPDVGSDPAFTTPGFLSLPPDDPFSSVPLSNISVPPPSAHTVITMLGDSRTHLAPPWHQLLRPFRTPGCSSTIAQIDNFGAYGSTTTDWLTCMRFRTTDICKTENMQQRVVIMLGGNDVRHRAGAWMHVPWSSLRTRLRNSHLDDIHSRFKSIVLFLRATGKAVVVQNHFGARPGSSSPLWLAIDEGMQGLRSRLYYEYTPGVHIVRGARVECSQYYTPCYIIKRDRSFGCQAFGWCNHVKFCYKTNICTKYDFRPPEFAFFPGVPGVRLANLPASFPRSHFHDDAHLNLQGLMSHAYHLSRTLGPLCWW